MRYLKWLKSCGCWSNYASDPSQSQPVAGNEIGDKPLFVHFNVNPEIKGKKSSSRGGAETRSMKKETLLLLEFVSLRASESPREIMFSGLSRSRVRNCHGGAPPLPEISATYWRRGLRAGIRSSPTHALWWCLSRICLSGGPTVEAWRRKGSVAGNYFFDQTRGVGRV